MIKLLSINEYFQRNDSNLKLMDNITFCFFVNVFNLL